MLDKNVTKNVYIGSEKFKANFGQSKPSGKLFFDINVVAATVDELNTISRNAINVCAKICIDFNSTLHENTTSEKKNGEETKKSRTTKKDKLVSSTSTPMKPEVNL